MKYFSMFSGIGGFELGIKNANMGWIQQELSERTNSKDIKDKRGLQDCWECIGYSEIDKYAIETYKKHFPTHKAYGDARNINPQELPDFDILCGGFPCQSFSIAGKRKGFQDTRGTLFHEICRIVAVKRPRLLFLENVKGLLSADNGRCFATILTSLDELGYSCEWQVLNSKYFGVPQNRERVFIIGHLRGTSARQIFPIRQTSQEPDKWASSLQHPGHSGGNYKGMNMVRELTGQRQGYRVYDTEGIMSCQNANAGGITKDNCIAVLTPNREEKRQNGRRFKEKGEEMFTLTGQDIHGVMIHNCLTEAIGRQGSSKEFKASCNTIAKTSGQIRRLTPIECERLQGFPDNWTIGSDTQRYKQCGNAVTVNVIEAIVSSLIRFTERK